MYYIIYYYICFIIQAPYTDHLIAKSTQTHSAVESRLSKTSLGTVILSWHLCTAWSIRCCFLLRKLHRRGKHTCPQWLSFLVQEWKVSLYIIWLHGANSKDSPTWQDNWFGESGRACIDIQHAHFSVFILG